MKKDEPVNHRDLSWWHVPPVLPQTSNISSVFIRQISFT